MTTSGLLLFAVCAGLVGCGETGDDYDSEVSCGDFCDKRYECDKYNPTTEEVDACVADCRTSIENECGNNHQAAANDKINQCVDKACDEFWSCMVFSEAPECFGFVTED